MKSTHQVLLISLVWMAVAGARPADADGKSPFLAPEDGALVVFIQNLPDDRAISYVVFDPDKKCVAEVGGRTAEVIPMKPGSYTFYVSAYHTRRIELRLAAGRTYFIRLSSVEKFATRIADVTLVQRGTDSYKLVKTWLKGATVVHGSDDRSRGKPLQERTNRTQRRINEANADWKNGDELFRFKYKLLEEDGFTAKEVGWL